jgi:hypothetical protein
MNGCKSGEYFARFRVVIKPSNGDCCAPAAVVKAIAATAPKNIRFIMTYPLQSFYRAS